MPLTAPSTAALSSRCWQTLGRSALVIVDVDEETPQAVDALVRACGGTLLRPPAD
ncbi:hypothetical protein [Pluralibacter gergoviae]|uniref:hypothetical protein n=1 Tax=Pluralibacter gergoviae TaxID=61647 RepID=UPI000AD4804C|nr:hypothetical protein [Pluralibacter gergoviae]